MTNISIFNLKIALSHQNARNFLRAAEVKALIPLLSLPARLFFAQPAPGNINLVL